MVELGYGTMDAVGKGGGGHWLVTCLLRDHHDQMQGILYPVSHHSVLHKIRALQYILATGPPRKHVEVHAPSWLLVFVQPSSWLIEVAMQGMSSKLYTEVAEKSE